MEGRTTERRHRELVIERASTPRRVELEAIVAALHVNELAQLVALGRKLLDTTHDTARACSSGTAPNDTGTAYLGDGAPDD
jgi:hypothetical protein